ncbi:MAG: hypothetical protein KAT70_07755, partial [Thermoplasmata archaeon]|nr:hypothetical protein [Thermoplasmata archaeon]
SDPVEVVVNEDSIDADFRVESDGDAAAFVIEGSSSNVTISTGDLKFSGDGSGVPFASIYGNDIGWTQAAAVQNTWYDIVDADMTTSELNELTHDGNGLITIITAGRYSIAWSITLSADTINHHYEGGIELDDGGSAEAPGQSHYEISNIAALANSDFPMSSVAILDLAASTTVEIAVRTTGAGTPDISVDHVNVVVTMEGGT